MSRPLFLSILLLISGVAPVFAQQAPQRITLQEALNRALERGFALERGANAVAQSEIAVASSRSAFLPTVNFNSSTAQSYGRQFVEGRFEDRATESLNFGVSAGVNLFNGYADQAEVARAGFARESAEQTLRRTRQNTLFDVASAYLNVLLRDEQLSVQEEALRQQQLQLQRVQQLIDAGARPSSDLFQQRAEVAQAELAVVNARRDGQTAQVQLVQRLRLDPAGAYTFEVPEDLIPALEEVQLGYQAEALISQALETRSDFQAVASTIEAAQQSERIARSTRLPRVNFNVSYGSGWTSAFTEVVRDPLTGLPMGTRDVPFFDQLDRRRSGSVQLSLAMPIYDRNATRLNTQRAQLAIRNAQLDREELQQAIAAQVQTALLDAQATAEQVRVTAVQVEAAEQALAAVQARYEAGAATLLEVTQAQTSVTRARSASVTAKYTLALQEQIIYFQVGTLDVSSFLPR